jgi:hypothetical protein
VRHRQTAMSSEKKEERVCRVTTTGTGRANAFVT